jgi:hypothetical protein
MTGSEMICPETIARRCYRLGLGAAKRRDLRAALNYASLARSLDPGHDGAARLAEICRCELDGAEEPALEGLMPLIRQKKWKAAAAAAERLPHQSVWLLGIEGCLWALAKRYNSAICCFTGVLARDRGNLLAANALAELGRRQKSFWRSLCFSLTK